MPKLPALSARTLVKFIEAKGFTLDHTTGSHFIFYSAYDKKRAVVPRHGKNLPKGTLLSILREAGFSRDDLLNFL